MQNRQHLESQKLVMLSQHLWPHHETPPSITSFQTQTFLHLISSASALPRLVRPPCWCPPDWFPGAMGESRRATEAHLATAGRLASVVRTPLARPSGSLAPKGYNLHLGFSVFVVVGPSNFYTHADRDPYTYYTDCVRRGHSTE